jgi:holo-[acyl-carrier protein] synthase
MQEIEEVRTSMETFGDRYVRRVYTDIEIDDCCKVATDAPSALASRFAAKEAVFKVLNDGDTAAMWQQIEVRLERGHPVLVLRGDAAALAAQQGITTMALSLSHSDTTAAAVVVAESTKGAVTDE